MAKRDDLVVITKTYDLILWSCQHTSRFPRNHRFVLGGLYRAQIKRPPDVIIAQPGDPGCNARLSQAGEDVIQYSEAFTHSAADGSG